MTVAELLARTSSRELAEWRAYEIEFGPLGPERGDWQIASLAHTFAALQSKRGRSLKVQDFLLQWSGKKKQSVAEQMAILKGFAAVQNERVRLGKET